MLTVVDKPVIQYVVDEAAEAGIEHFVFVTGRGKANHGGVVVHGDILWVSQKPGADCRSGLRRDYLRAAARQESDFGGRPRRARSSASISL